MATRKERERRRGKRQENRHERRQEQHAGGGDWDCIRRPEGMEVFKPEGGETYHIDVIPYIVGKYNKNADVGDEYFELSYAVYNNLGIDEKKFTAIGEMLGVRDPVAEHFAVLKKQNAEWDDMKDFKPKWRQLMLVFVHEQAEKGLQLFEGAYGTFGELLDEEIRGEEKDYIDNFDDPDHGATLEVRFKAKNIGQKNPWVLAAKINFDERDNGFDADGNKKLAAEIMSQAAEICLDDCLKISDYDTLKAALDGEPVGVDDGDDAGDEEDEKPRGRGRQRDRKPVDKEPEPENDDDAPEPEQEEEPEEEPEEKPKGKTKGGQPTAADLGIEKGGDVEHDEYGLCTVIRVAKDGLTVTIMDENDTVHKGVDPTDLEPVDCGPAPEEEPEEKSKGKTKGEHAAEEESEKTGGDEDWDEGWEN
jgi:hypothetical protein